jgi:hypothetical protein
VELTDDQLVKVMQLLGFSPEDFAAVHLAGPVAGPAMVDSIKRQAKRAYRKLALELHPDRTGGDPAKTELFKALTEVMSEIDELRYIPPRRSYPWAKVIQLRWRAA